MVYILYAFMQNISCNFKAVLFNALRHEQRIIEEQEKKLIVYTL